VINRRVDGDEGLAVLQVFLLCLGFVLLTKGAGWLIDGGTYLAGHLGLSPLMVGLTVVAWGTSLPELVVTVLASLDGHSSLGLGNAIGSNIANIGLVLGSCAVLLPATLAWKIRRRDRAWLLGSVVFLWLVLFWGQGIGRVGGTCLLGLFGLYNVYLWRMGRQGDTRKAPSSEEQSLEGAPRTLKGALLKLVVASVFVSIGALFIVHSATFMAEKFGVPERVIGLSVVAIGTSLPELAAGIAAALKGKAEIGIGNVIGSNIFNTLAVVGVAGTLQPYHEAETIGRVLSLDLPVTLAFSVAAILLPRWGGRSSVKGWLLLMGYFAFLLMTQV
jgi:cation:H+ antiporter